MSNTLVIPSITETLATGVIAAAEGICAITGEKLRLQFSLERKWEFFAGDRKVSSFARQDFYSEARAVIRGYLASEAAT